MPLSGEAIRLMNYIDDVAVTLRRVLATIPSLTAEERARVAEHLLHASPNADDVAQALAAKSSAEDIAKALAAKSSAEDIAKALAAKSSAEDIAKALAAKPAPLA